MTSGLSLAELSAQKSFTLCCRSFFPTVLTNVTFLQKDSFLTILSKCNFSAKTDGPLLTLEHTGVALAAAACLPEGSRGTYVSVPVLLLGSLTKCLYWGNFSRATFYQPIGPSSWFFNKSLNQRLYKLTGLAAKDLIG